MNRITLAIVMSIGILFSSHKANADRITDWDIGEKPEDFSAMRIDPLFGTPESVQWYDEAGADVYVVSTCAMWCGPCQQFAANSQSIVDVMALEGIDVKVYDFIFQNNAFLEPDASDAQDWLDVLWTADPANVWFGGAIPESANESVTTNIFEAFINKSGSSSLAIPALAFLDRNLVVRDLQAGFQIDRIADSIRTTASIPEPGSIGVLVFGVIIFLPVRTRRRTVSQRRTKTGCSPHPRETQFVRHRLRHRPIQLVALPRTLATLTLFVVLPFFGKSANGQITSVWNGSDGDWTDSFRWSSSSFPNNSTFTKFVASINSGSVRLDQNIVIEALQLNGGRLNGGLSLSLEGNGSNWQAGTIDGIVLNSEGSFAIGGASSKQLTNATFLNRGSTIWTDGNIVAGNSAIDNSGTFRVAGNSAKTFASNGNTLFNNVGLFQLDASAGTTTFNSTFNNSDRVIVAGGRLNLRGGGTSSGSLQVTSGNTLSFTQGDFELDEGTSVEGAGTVEIAQGAFVNFNSDSWNNGSLRILGGSLIASRPITVDHATMNDGLLDGTIVNVDQSQFGWNGGEISSTALIANQGILISGSSEKRLSGDTVGSRIDTNGGLWLEGNIVSGRNSVINHRSGTFVVSATGEFNTNLGGEATFNNQAEFVRRSNSSATTFAAEFNNSGQVTIEQGTLALMGGGNSSGDWDVQNGSTLRFAGGQHSLDSGTSMSGAGAIEIHESDVILNSGRWNTSGRTRITGGGSLSLNSLTTIGALDVEDGMLQVNSFVSSTQALNIGVNGNLSGNGPINNSFTGDVNNSGVIGGGFTINGNVIESGGGRISVGSNQLVINGNLNAINPIEMTGGQVTINGDAMLHNPLATTTTGTLVLNGKINDELNITTRQTTFATSLVLGDNAESVFQFNENGFDSWLVSGLLERNGALRIQSNGGFAGLDFNESFQITNAIGPSTGEFDGLSEGARVGNFDGVDLFISYRGGNGDDTIVTTEQVPQWIGGSGNWSDSSKWINGVPNENSTAVLLDKDPSVNSIVTTLGQTPVVQQLRIDAGDTLIVERNGNSGADGNFEFALSPSSNLASARLDNSGVVQVDAGDAIDFRSDLEISGTGTIQLLGSNAVLRQFGINRQLVNGVDHTIQGAGIVGAKTIDNLGLIDANVPTSSLTNLTLSGQTNLNGGSPFRDGTLSNSGTLRASNGGGLEIGIRETNGGVIEAIGQGSRVLFRANRLSSQPATLIRNVTFRSSEGGFISINGNNRDVAFLENVVNEGFIQTQHVRLFDSLHNTGQIQTINNFDDNFSLGSDVAITGDGSGVLDFVQGGNAFTGDFQLSVASNLLIGKGTIDTASTMLLNSVVDPNRGSSTFPEVGVFEFLSDTTIDGGKLVFDLYGDRVAPHQNTNPRDPNINLANVFRDISFPENGLDATNIEYDQLNFFGALTVDGNIELELSFVDGFIPEDEDFFDILTADQLIINGQFVLNAPIVDGKTFSFDVVNLLDEGAGFNRDVLRLTWGTTAVPEPATGIPFCLALVASMSRRNRRQK